MTDPSEAQSMTAYHVALVSAENRTILAVRNEEELRLPRIAVPTARRPIEQLQRAINGLWGLKAVILDFICPNESALPCVLAEALVVPSHLSRNFVSLAEIPDKAISVHERIALQNLFHDSGCLGPLSRLGWLDEARSWIQESVPGGSDLFSGDVRQINACGGFALVHFGTREGCGYWLKATGPPNTHEYTVTTALSRTLPEFLPSIVAARRDWNAWVMEDCGQSLRRKFVGVAFEIAVRALASLQLQTTSLTDVLLESGCRDQRIKVFLDHLDEITDYLDEAMRHQMSTKAPRLGRNELRQLNICLRGACSEMQDLQVPDALLHGDMNPGNILFDGARCVFIDWSEAYVGNPLLAFEGLAAHLTVTHRTATWVQRLRELYKQKWQSVLSAACLERAFALTPLLAIAMSLLGRGDWLQSSRRADPAFQAYARSLARKMYLIAQKRETLEAPCL